MISSTKPAILPLPIRNESEVLLERSVVRFSTLEEVGVEVQNSRAELRDFIPVK
jgi:hypothetical protein